MGAEDASASVHGPHGATQPPCGRGERARCVVSAGQHQPVEELVDRCSAIRARSRPRFRWCGRPPTGPGSCVEIEPGQQCDGRQGLQRACGSETFVAVLGRQHVTGLGVDHDPGLRPGPSGASDRRPRLLGRPVDRWSLPMPQVAARRRRPARRRRQTAAANDSRQRPHMTREATWRRPASDAPGDQGALDLLDRLRDLDPAGAGLGAVEGGAAAPDALAVVEDVQALGGALRRDCRR